MAGEEEGSEVRVRALQVFRMLAIAVFFIWFPTAALAAGASVAVFPLQELGEGRNDANLPMTKALAERLAESGSEIIGLKTVISFMAHNRIRLLGHLDTFHLSRVREDLGAAFVLLGTVSQRKERPEASLGLTLNLVRTSDARTVWTYVGSLSTGEERRMLGIGEPQSTAELQPLLFDEVIDQWPWQIINEVQQTGSIIIDSVVLEPRQVRPGEQVFGRVRLRPLWPGEQRPKVFFKAQDQLFPAALSPDGTTYEGNWTAGEENGRFPVTMLVEWPLYGRSESALLGNYLVDGTLPLLEMNLQGVTLIDGMPVFRKYLIIVPRMLVRKPLDRWRLAFYFDNGELIGDMGDNGNLPESFVWTARDGMGSLENGIYKVEIEVWDKAGNSAKVTKRVGMNRDAPRVNVAMQRTEEGMVLDLAHRGKVPLDSWRMELWTKEGKVLTQAQGKELPVKLQVEIPEADQDQEIQGFVIVKDLLGTRVRRKIADLLPKIKEKTEPKKNDSKGTSTSESWVDEF